MAVVIPINRKGYETCVLCRRLTDVPKTKPVELRDHYIEGAGQLCPDCYHKLYGPVKEQQGREWKRAGRPKGMSE